MTRWWLVWFLGCVGSPEETGSRDDTGETGESGESGDSGDTDQPDDTGGETGDTAPRDGDGDGHLPPEDCDDTDPYIHPGATEIWNGLDDDCDGRRDGDGDYVGEARVAAQAIYKGRPERFDLVCPTTLTRAAQTLTWEVACVPDPDDALAVLLLGELLTISADTDDAGAGTWEGQCTIASSAGWDSPGDATASWASFSEVEIGFSLSAASLSVGGSVTVTVRAD